MSAVTEGISEGRAPGRSCTDGSQHFPLKRSAPSGDGPRPPVDGVDFFDAAARSAWWGSRDRGRARSRGWCCADGADRVAQFFEGNDITDAKGGALGRCGPTCSSSRTRTPRSTRRRRCSRAQIEPLRAQCRPRSTATRAEELIDPRRPRREHLERYREPSAASSSAGTFALATDPKLVVMDEPVSAPTSRLRRRRSTCSKTSSTDSARVPSSSPTTSPSCAT